MLALGGSVGLVLALTVFRREVAPVSWREARHGSLAS
jgi:hypothetical protein